MSKDKSSNASGSASLITTLLSIYFEYYGNFMGEAKKMKEDGNISGYAQQNERAQKYETLALNLMMNQKAKSHLDPLIVLNSIPDEWEIITEHRDVISLLSSMFDQTLTTEENIEISKNLSKMERQQN